MKKFIIIMLAAVLMQSALSVAGAQSTASRPKPSSFVPHSRTKHHVYGAPIRPAIGGAFQGLSSQANAEDSIVEF